MQSQHMRSNYMYIHVIRPDLQMGIFHDHDTYRNNKYGDIGYFLNFLVSEPGRLK